MPMRKSLQNYPKRGEIYITDLNPSFGHEIHKKRPVLIISHNSFNQTFPTVVVIPFSSIVPDFVGPDVVKVTLLKGLDKPSLILIHQIRVVDKARLIKKIGSLTKQKFAEVEESLKLVLGLAPFT